MKIEIAKKKFKNCTQFFAIVNRINSEEGKSSEERKLRGEAQRRKTDRGWRNGSRRKHKEGA